MALVAGEKEGVVAADWAPAASTGPGAVSEARAAAPASPEAKAATSTGGRNRRSRSHTRKLRWWSLC